MVSRLTCPNGINNTSLCTTTQLHNNTRFTLQREGSEIFSRIKKFIRGLLSVIYYIVLLLSLNLLIDFLLKCIILFFLTNSCFILSQKYSKYLFYYLKQGQATIFVRGPYCAFICVSWAKFQSKRLIQS